MLIRDPFTGEIIRRANAGEILRVWTPEDPPVVPEHVQALLDRAEELGPYGPTADVEWRSILTPKGQRARSGTQITGSLTETILIPDYTFAADTVQPGDVYKYTIFLDNSTVITTPGTIIHRLRWGGVAGVSLAASGAFAPDPTAASTNVSGFVEYYMVIRSIGAAGTAMTMGRMCLSDYDDASVTTIVGNLNMSVIPTSAPVVATIDTTASKALSATVTHSVSTAGTNTQAHIAILETLV